MISRILSTLVVVAASGLVSACKVAVVVVEGGAVTSTFSGSCTATNICIHEISNSDFTETFTAVPQPDWRFVRWNSGGDFLCEDETSTQCLVSTVGTEGNSAIEAIIASDKTYYIMPVFEYVGASLTDVVFANGKIWAQVTAFNDVSWGQMNTVCPAGNCNGPLNGYDMRGWKWATVDELNALFNSYIGAPAMGPGPSIFESNGLATFYTDFYNDGWNYTPETSPTREQTIGLVAGDEGISCSGIGFEALVPVISAFTGLADNVGRCDSETAGGWFYFDP